MTTLGPPRFRRNASTSPARPTTIQISAKSIVSKEFSHRHHVSSLMSCPRRLSEITSTPLWPQNPVFAPASSCAFGTRSSTQSPDYKLHTGWSSGQKLLTSIQKVQR